MNPDLVFGRVQISMVRDVIVTVVLHVIIRDFERRDKISFEIHVFIDFIFLVSRGMKTVCDPGCRCC